VSARDFGNNEGVDIKHVDAYGQTEGWAKMDKMSK
jgi:hypothetical protein